MRLHHYFAVGLKLFSVVLLVYGLRFIAPLIQVVQDGHLNGIDVNEYFFLINFLLIFSVAAILWMFPVTLAKKFLNPEMDLPVEPIGTPTVLAVFIAAIGLFVFTYGLIDMLYWSVFWHMVSNNPEIMTANEDADSVANTIATVFQLAFSLLLIYKCRTISGYINRVSK